MNGELELKVTQVSTRNGYQYQCLEITILDDSGRIQPNVLRSLKLPADLDLSQGVILWGACPTWLAGYLVERCQSAPWVGCYNLPSGSVVVVASNSPELAIADSFRFVPNQPLGNALLIGGPPDSGKSILSYALSSCLKAKRRDKAIHLHRAQWDGEGNWFHETNDRDMAEELSLRYKAAWSDRFFLYHANAVNNIREAVDLVFVDFGGRFQRRDVTLLNSCTHYIIISKEPELMPKWHDFCRKEGGLMPVAVIHSVLEERCDVLQTEPFLEIIAGPWQRGKTTNVPKVLLDEVMKLLTPES
jgi:CRISPR-associated protein Csx3